ncbi:MAG: ABC transporter substrate-binding protein [Chloroflexi bacterium]|nr:ABC transporter substrate-binding protein [Chloroflexota bacterium]
MNRKHALVFFSVLIIITMALAACAKATPVAPVATAAPVAEPTAAPTAANPLQVTLSFRNVDRAYLPYPDKVAQEIQAQLKEVGIEVTLEEMESAAFIDAASAGKLGFFLLGWNADYPDSTNFYDAHFNAQNGKQFGTMNPELLAEMSAAAQLFDPAARQTHYDTVNQLLKDDVVMIPVAHGGSSVAYQANVVGGHSSPLGNELFSVVGNGTDQFVWMQNGEPASLWCGDESDGETLRACEQVYESLLGFSIGGTDIVTVLAESFAANTEATEYTFKLRQGVKFQNGADFDANDVVATFVAQWDAMSPNHVGRTMEFYYWGAFFGAFLNTETAVATLTDTNGLISMVAPSCDYGGEMKSIEAVDAGTVKFTLCFPDPAFTSKVAFSAFAIQDKEYLDANSGDSMKMSVAPNGTGPYKVKAWNTGDSVVFEANPNYWGTPALTKNLIFRWSEQSAQRLLELQAGTVNGIDNPGPDDVATIEADANLKLYPRNGFNIFYIGFNNTIAPFDNLEVRKAISYAIDRQRIVDQFYAKGSSVAINFVPAFVKPGASLDIPWYEFDQTKAKEALVNAGFTTVP